MTKLNTDCFRLIFCQTDQYSLHSCLLVNKEWCNIVVPILWKEYSWYSWKDCDPILRMNTKIGVSEKKLFNVILSCLSSSSKQLLSDNNIKLPSTILLKPLLFNYISFCQFPQAGIVNRIMEMVFKEQFN